MKGLSLLAAAGLSAGLFAAELVNQFPVRVLYAKGDVAAAEAGMVEDGKSVTLAWKPGGGQPVVAYDYGGRTVGGYAVFKVTGFKAQDFAWGQAPQNYCFAGWRLQ